MERGKVDKSVSGKEEIRDERSDGIKLSNNNTPQGNDKC